MKVVVFSCLFLFFSCSDSKDNSFSIESIDKSVVKQHDSINQLNDMKKNSLCNANCIDTVLIKLSNQVSFRWSNVSHEIVEDKLFLNIKKQFSQHYLSIVEDITDTTLTKAIECTSHRQLFIGDLAFLLIDKINNIPYFSVLGTQLDTYTYGCKYPSSLFDYLNFNRYKAKSMVKEYLENKI